MGYLDGILGRSQKKTAEALPDEAGKTPEPVAETSQPVTPQPADSKTTALTPQPVTAPVQPTTPIFDSAPPIEEKQVPDMVGAVVTDLGADTQPPKEEKKPEEPTGTLQQGASIENLGAATPFEKVSSPAEEKAPLDALAELKKEQEGFTEAKVSPTVGVVPTTPEEDMTKRLRDILTKREASLTAPKGPAELPIPTSEEKGALPPKPVPQEAPAPPTTPGPPKDLTELEKKIDIVPSSDTELPMKRIFLPGAEKEEKVPDEHAKAISTLPLPPQAEAPPEPPASEEPKVPAPPIPPPVPASKLPPLAPKEPPKAPPTAHLGIKPLKPKPVALPGPLPPPKLKPEDIPEDLKAHMKEALPSHRKLLESYGVCEIYELPHHRKLYALPVPKPHGPEKAIINTVREAATRLITISPDEIEGVEKRRAFFKKRILEIIEASPELGVPASKMDFYADTIMREMIGYGALDLLLQDDKLEDIMINGPNKPVYVFHREHEMMPTNLLFGSDDEIIAIIDRIARDVGRRIDIKDPLLDARLPDGSRVNATIPPISLEGSTITIRKFREDPFTFVDLVKYGTMDAELAAFFWVAVEGMSAKPANILVAGGTASGKTTTLNVLASFIPANERIVTIEDTAEIKLPVDHWIRFETRPPGIEGKGEINMDTLLKNTLRMRPDRVIVGEIRGPEAFTLFTAMNTGHDGSLGTVHSNNAQETVVRLKSPPMNVPETMLAALDFVVVQKRIHDRRKGTIRRISEVAELSGILEGEPEFNYLFIWDPATDSYKSSYETSKYLQELSRFTGLSNTALRKEIQKREGYIKSIIKKGVTSIDEVCLEIQKRVG